MGVGGSDINPKREFCSCAFPFAAGMVNTRGIRLSAEVRGEIRGLPDTLFFVVTPRLAGVQATEH